MKKVNLFSMWFLMGLLAFFMTTDFLHGQRKKIPLCVKPQLESGLQVLLTTQKEKELVELINNYRASKGLRTLKIDERLRTAAWKHSKEMYDKRYFSHFSPTPGLRHPQDRVRAEGATFTGENCARAKSSPKQVFEGWKKSPGHNRTMLAKIHKTIGVGEYRRYWTADFGMDSVIPGPQPKPQPKPQLPPEPKPKVPQQPKPKEIEEKKEKKPFEISWKETTGLSKETEEDKDNEAEKAKDKEAEKDKDPDTFHLDDGSKIEGELISETKDTYVIKALDGKTIEIEKGSVIRIEKEELASPSDKDKKDEKKVEKPDIFSDFEGFDELKDSGKPIIIYFYWPGYGPEEEKEKKWYQRCQKFENNILFDHDIAKATEKFERYMVNGEECNSKILKKYKVNKYPTLVIFDALSKRLHTLTNHKVKPKFLAKKLNEYAKKSKKAWEKYLKERENKKQRDE